MPSPSAYVPILKGKKGEIDALSELTGSLLDVVVPFFDVPRHTQSARAGKDLAAHLKKFAKDVGGAWESGPVYVDLFDIPLHRRLSTGAHPVPVLFEELATHGVEAIPVTGLDRDADYNMAVKEVCAIANRGVCIRLQKDDIEVPEDMIDEIAELLSEIAIPIDSVHFVLDLRSIRTLDVSVGEGMILESLHFLQRLGRPKTIVLAASNMPQSLSEDVATNSVGYIERKEVSLWNRVAARLGNVNPPLAFGDYATVHPDYADLDPRLIANTMGPSIRYTVANNWLVLRGGRFQGHPDGYGQYFTLAAILVGMAEFLGRNFSFGSSEIDDKASRHGGTGNPGTWVKIAVNHHLVYVCKAVANGGLS
jgi:hypothetical protein